MSTYPDLALDVHVLVWPLIRVDTTSSVHLSDRRDFPDGPANPRKGMG
jgi:hypothetical protein